MRPLAHLSDDDLITVLKHLAQEERRVTRRFLEHLLEFDRRDIALNKVDRQPGIQRLLNSRYQ